jgi:hypothetical protein
MNPQLMQKLSTLIQTSQDQLDDYLAMGNPADAHTMWLTGHIDAYKHLFNLAKKGEIA